MRKQGLRSRRDFETTASSLGLYFDKIRLPPFLAWLFSRGGLAALLAAAAAALAVLFLYSLVTQLEGNFTINLSEDMLKAGFVLSESEDFAVTSSYLYSDYVEDALPVSISNLDLSVADIDGNASTENYFAYTFYCRNEGEVVASYTYQLNIISESQSLSGAAWVMLFDDDGLRIFAKANDDGTAAAIPALNDSSRGYRSLDFISMLTDSSQVQSFQGSSRALTYYRVVPYAFEDDQTVVSGAVQNLQPGEYRKYTVLLWLEGDDPDCTDELVGGHLGLQMNFALDTTGDNDGSSAGAGERGGVWESVSSFFSGLFNGLKFW